MVAAGATAALAYMGLTVRDVVQGLPEWTYHGPGTTELSTGQGVVLIRDAPASEAGEVIKATGYTGDKSWMYKWEYDYLERAKFTVPGGTAGVVAVDPAWDDDSCNPRRPIGVTLLNGPHKGKTVAIPRDSVRRG